MNVGIVRRLSGSSNVMSAVLNGAALGSSVIWRMCVKVAVRQCFGRATPDGIIREIAWCAVLDVMRNVGAKYSATKQRIS